MADSVYALFRETAAARGEAVAARHWAGDAWRDVSWRALAADVEHAAAGLVRLGVQPGDRVSILANSRLEWAIADLAIMGAAAVTVPIYQSNTPAECEYLLDDAGSVVVFAEDAAQLEKLRRIRGATPQVRTVVCFTGDAVERDSEREMSWDDFLAAGAAWLADHPGAVSERAATLAPASLLTIIYTSGTTGPPKGAALTHDNMLYEAEAIRGVGMVGPDDVQYLFLPLAHAFAKALAVAWFTTGHVMAFWRRDQKRLLDDLGEIRPTVFAAVPRVFEKVHARIVEDIEQTPGLAGRFARWGLTRGRAAAAAEAAGTPLRDPGWAIARRLVFGQIGRRLAARLGGRLRFCVSGGGPLSRELAFFFQYAGLRVCEGYGLTETSAGSTINLPDAIRPGTVGRPLPGTEIRVAPDGELLIRGRGVMRGYWNRDADTRDTIDADGWFHTGDIGEIDADGFVRITDRKKDIIVTAGGKKVAPQNLENMLKSLSPIVSQVVVHGDLRRFLTALVTLDAEAAAAWARQRGIADTDLPALSQHPAVTREVQQAVDALNRDLPSYATLKRIAILDHEFEIGQQLTPTFKVKRQVCVRLYREQLEAMYE